MRDLDPLDGDVEELDGRGLCALPGLVDCHTHPAFGGDRVEEFSLRAGGASYEELHAAGGGILSTVRATRAAGEDGLAEAVDAPPRLDAARRHDDVRGEVGLRARPRDRARVAARGPRGGRRPDLARRARGPARVRRRRRLPRLRCSPRCCPRRRSSPRRPTSSSSAAPSTPRRRAATSRRAATQGLALRLHGDQFTEAGAIPLAIELGARSVDHLEATGAGRRRARSPRATSTGVLLPASALFLGRPMPPARALVDAGAAVALATDFNPGSAFCESLPLVCSLAATQLHLSPAEALAACTVNAAHVLGRADRLGRIAPGYAADLDAPRRARLALPRLPPRRRRRRGRRQGRRRVALDAARHTDAMPTKKQRRRREKLKRHEYEEVYVDEEGRELEPDEAEELDRRDATPRESARSAKSQPSTRGGPHDRAAVAGGARASAGCSSSR